MSKYKIAISGSYGGLNLGDEAILEVMIREIKKYLDAEIVVFSINPSDTIKRHNIRALAAREMHKDEIINELKTLDLLIFGGGGILFGDYVEVFLREVIWANELNIPVMVYAISAGPVGKPEYKKLISDTFNKVEIITVRENEAKKFLNNIGVNKEIYVTADPAFLLETSPFPKKIENIFTSKGPIVGFSIREPGAAFNDVSVDVYHEILANAADFMIERFNAQILFVPMETHEFGDMQHSHAVISKMLNAKNAYVLKRDYSSSQILDLMHYMTFAVGMRLHFLIFATIQKIPFVPLPYASKVKGLLDDLEMPMAPLSMLNSGSLCAFLDRFWDGKKNMVEKIESKLPGLKERAHETRKILVDFINHLQK